MLSIFSCACWPSVNLWRNVCLGLLPSPPFKLPLLFVLKMCLFLAALGLCHSAVFLQFRQAEAALQLQHLDFSFWWLLLLRSSGPNVRVPVVVMRGPAVVLHGLSAPWHVESSCTRDGTCVPCIGRRINNHWTPREVLCPCFDWVVWVFFLIELYELFI